MKYLGTELGEFSEQIKFAVNQYKEHGIRKDDLENVIVCGLGGSGIAGKITKDYFIDKFDLPIELVSGYNLPKFAGEKTLVILCSYSGNTEETLSCYDIAKEKACKILCVTVGGKLGELAVKDGYAVYRAESGYQPRVAFGYPITYLMLIFSELLGLEKKAEFLQIADTVANVDNYTTKSAILLEPFKSTIRHKYVIIADTANEGIAVRFANQLQENAKAEAFVVVLPEANHNVIETYYYKQDSNFILLNSGINQRINLRFYFIKELLSKFDSTILEIIPKENTLTHLIDNIYLLDWLSLQIANELGAVSNSIENINQLKNYLAKH